MALPFAARRAARPRGGGASTSQGHPRTVFRRALERGNLLVAEAAARGLPRVGLADALELTLLIAQNSALAIALTLPLDKCGKHNRPAQSETNTKLKGVSPAA